VNRKQLEHIIRAASSVIEDDGVVIVVSQAILGNYRDTALPDRLRRSIEADVLPLHDDAEASQADAIEGGRRPCDQHGLRGLSPQVRGQIHSARWEGLEPPTF
jgi:hypothetical protein